MKTLNSNSQKKRQSAFTLIEIMVATVIMIVLTGLVIQITSEVLKVWSRSSGKLAANAEARIAMDLLTQDLEAAVFRNNDLQWLRSEKDSTSLGTNTVALRLFAPALDRPSTKPDGTVANGDICAIAYQLENRDPVSGSAALGDPDKRIWSLYRLVVNPQDTFDHLIGGEVQRVLPDESAIEWKGAVWSGESITGLKGSNYLVGNIVAFNLDFYVNDDDDDDTQTKVVFHTRYGCGLPNPNIKTGATVGPQAFSWMETPNDQQMAYRQPLAYAEIKLTVISDEGAQLLQNITKIPETEEEVILQHGEVFTRRVNFLARPL
jgi:type II secretory pathway pseudopilin PulG